MKHYEIKTATAIYTGGGIYIYYGQLENGSYFRASDVDDYISICDADTSTDDADYGDFYEEHEIDDLQGYDFETFFNNMLQHIINNRPDGNYSTGELENRMITRVSDPRDELQEQIKKLENELSRLKRIDELQTFLDHMRNTFDVLMGDNCTSESVDQFYRTPFTISFNGETIVIDNGADTFQEIEYTIQREIDELTE